jgi:hypothetical protein
MTRTRTVHLARWSVAVAVVAMLGFWLAALRCPMAFDYAESDVATWIWLLRHHHDLYRATAGEPFLGSNYPPLQLVLVTWLAGSDASILVVGRVLSLVAIAATAIFVGLNVAHLGSSRAAGVAAALLFVATARAGYFAAVCRPDAIALTLDAAAVTLCARRVRGWPWASAILFAASLLCKHNLVAGPIAVAVWAWRRDRAAALHFTMTLALVVGCVVIGGSLVEPLVRWSLAGYSVTRLLRWLVYAIAPSLFGLVAIVRALWTTRPARGSPLEVWTHVLIAAVVATLALGRIGSSANYVLELVLALVIVGATVAPFTVAWRCHRIVTAIECLAVVTYQLAIRLPNASRESIAARAWMADARGPVLAETTWYATQAGRAPLTIPFLATQLTNGASAAPLLREAPRCDRLLFNFDLDDAEAWRAHRDRILPDLIATLRAGHRYRLVEHVGELYVYAPRNDLSPRPQESVGETNPLSSRTAARLQSHARGQPAGAAIPALRRRACLRRLARVPRRRCAHRQPRR